MRIILLENIKGLGQMGDIKNVKDGYGRNFLLPRSLAKIATAGAEKQAELLKQKLTKLIEIENQNTQAIADKLKDFVLEINEKANKSGTLYEGVTPKIISEKLSENGFEINEEKIILKEPIKKVGEHIAILQLTDAVSSEIKLKIDSE